MIDINFLRKNPEKVKIACKNKGVDIDIDNFLELDAKKRKLQQEIDLIRAERNKITQKDIFKGKELKTRLRELEGSFDSASKDLAQILYKIPNIPFDNVPIGKDDSQNVVLRKTGKTPNFKFQSKDYLEIGGGLGLIDIERASKVAGSRFGYIKDEAVLIEFSLIKLGLDILTKEGFIPIVPPVMLKRDMAKGTGYFESTDEKEAYFIPEDNLYLAGTSEQPLIAMHADEILEEKDLPKRYVGFSTCFRREAGSYGKDTKGILRVHQFDKLEMVSFTKPEDSQKEHKLLLSMEEKLMKSLKLPYQVVNICTGDLGLPAAAKYDIEAWIPSENKYRETHSTSNCTDFQARRLDIRYKDKAGKLNFVHTLNGTAFAIGRILIAIIENYQQKDGSVKVPSVLQKYTGFKVIKKDTDGN